jgi:twitching motility protein PilT
MAAIDRYLTFLGERGGSDLHLAAGRKLVVRLDGSIAALKGGILSPDECDSILAEILPEPNRQELQEKGDTDFAYDLPGVARFRVNVYKDMRGLGGAFRLIPRHIRSMDELGLPDPVKDMCYLPKGIVLVTGPTGSGKSTTLAAMIDLINSTRKCHVVTIEDPIEFVHEDKGCRINQREVHSHTESFARALRAALRQDPDVVLVGEMRDLETTRIAIETAETGHLVLATLHTTTAAATIDRLISQFPTDEQEQIRSMLADVLRGVVSQTLLRAKGGGRVAAFEVLICTTAVQVSIRERKIPMIPSLMQTGAKTGMRLLNDSLLRLVVTGKVEAEDALAKTLDREDLLQKFRVAGVEFATRPAWRRGQG